MFCFHFIKKKQSTGREVIPSEYGVRKIQVKIYI